MHEMQELWMKDIKSIPLSFRPSSARLILIAPQTLVLKAGCQKHNFARFFNLPSYSAPATAVAMCIKMSLTRCKIQYGSLSKQKKKILLRVARSCKVSMV